MPRLSNYRPEKGNDFKFIDKQIYEMFTVGGTDVYVHKYLGPADPANPSSPLGELTIQDVLFLENRDRKYDPTIYVMRGVYNLQDLDFNLSQFGLFLQNDTIFMTVHINNTVETLGRKIVTGDVIELPHLKDDFGLNDFKTALKRYYVVEDVTRAAEGFSVTWYPHLYRLKLKPIIDSQEFKDILETPLADDNFAGDYDPNKTYYKGQIIRWKGILYEVTQTVTNKEPPNTDYFRPLDSTETTGGVMSDYLKILEINQAIKAEAESDAPYSGFDTSHYYTLAVDEEGNSALVTVDETNISIDDANTADAVNEMPVKDGYNGYLLGDGIAPNGAPYGFGIKFPGNAAVGDFYLRTDYLPNRLFRYDGKRWVKYEDKVRHTLSNTDNRQTYKTKFINNEDYSNVGLIQMDAFKVENPKTFRDSDQTASFTFANKKIITKTTYNVNYGVELYINDVKVPVTNIINENGKIAFTIDQVIEVGDMLQWATYREKIKQRQSLSQALRPRADF
jgi:hypothetical protein